MAHYGMKVVRSQDHGEGIALYRKETGLRGIDVLKLIHVYPPQEQYPLANGRYINDAPDLFLDIVDILDGNAGDYCAADTADAGSLPGIPGSAVHLRSLCSHAARRAADGSGNARRFKDARALWDKIEKHVLEHIVTPEAQPITDVRRSHNWKKNQPYKGVPANPDAWFVTEVYSRSNPRKDVFKAYRGINAVFDALLHAEDTGEGNIPSSIGQIREAIAENLDYPYYGEIAALLGDSNMLVFHNAESLAQWLRSEAGQHDAVFPDTPVEVYTVPDNTLDKDDPRYLPAQLRSAAGHFANIIAPKQDLRS
ncbi:hypothetical protein [Scardovia wiggsiae]|uniref:hypothetical protein n=1 Tax=Scardovia wiggsiae TaxID=230143 RepID=UPI00374F6B97